MGVSNGLRNDLVNMSNGGRFHAGWAGGQLGGALIASGAGAFAAGFGSGFVSTATGIILQNAFEGPIIRRIGFSVFL